MEFIQLIFQDLSQCLISHPLYSAVASIILLIILLCCLVHFYCRLTVGICDSHQDMTNKTVLITGSSAGIGKLTAMEMARRNARVLLACRNPEKANKVADEIKKVTGNQNVFVKQLDLTSFASVRACAKSVLETEEKLHVLINNAGVAGARERKLTKDGCEITMQSNHLGHFLLTLLLLDLLKRSTPSRIINLSSEAHRYQRLDTEDMSNIKRLSSFLVYGNTKLANILFTAELADRLRESGVTVNALHPGVVKTDIGASFGGFLAILMALIFLVAGKTPEEGAQTTIRLAVDPRLEKTTGKYFVDCKEAKVSRAAKNKKLAERLFEVSEKIVGEPYCKQ